MWDSPAVEQYDKGISEDSRELISMDSKKLAAPPSSSQQGTLRVSDYHDRNVKERSFNVGDLVLRRI
jgi:hypothetical protein